MSSITDSDSLETFGSLCQQASRDLKVFNQFRSTDIMVKALDHVSLEQGKLYLREISKREFQYPNVAHTLKFIDHIGNPKKFYFNGLGLISPTLLRYLKVLMDLRELFGPLGKLRISEIGVGFGGQASLIQSMEGSAAYNLYDIPPVLDLSRFFIERLGINGNFTYLNGREPVTKLSDLLLSNYAFSELTASLQEDYLHKVLLNSKRGYITWNSLAYKHLGGYSLADLIRHIPNCELLPEVPLTAEGNAILVWGHSWQ